MLVPAQVDRWGLSGQDRGETGTIGHGRKMGGDDSKKKKERKLQFNTSAKVSDFENVYLERRHLIVV